MHIYVGTPSEISLLLFKGTKMKQLFTQKIIEHNKYTFFNE